MMRILGCSFGFFLLFGASIRAQGPERLNVDGLGRLPAFSHATVAGDLIFVSGTLGTKAEAFELAEGGVGAQTTQALKNIERILAGAGAGLRDIAKVNVYLTDMSKFAEMNEAYLKIMGGEPPARTTIGVTGLALGAAVEIECVAQKPKSAAAAAMKTPGRSTGDVESAGEKIYYESTGEGEAIVLCHGYGGNHAVWYQQVPAFAQSHRVITWDQRGFGRSTNLAGKVDPITAASDLKALLDHLHIERAHIVGQSMGGWTALEFALQNTDRVLSLTLTDTIGGIYTLEIERSFDEFLKASAAAPKLDAPPIGRHPALNKSFADRDLAKAFLYEEISSLAPPASTAIPGILRSTAVDHSRLKSLKAPVHFVVGSDDNIFQPATIQEAAKLIPGSRTTFIDGAGHSAYFEKPEEWNTAVMKFIEGARRK